MTLPKKYKINKKCNSMGNIQSNILISLIDKEAGQIKRKNSVKDNIEKKNKLMKKITIRDDLFNELLISDVDLDDQEKLLLYARQLLKLKEIKDKSEDLKQREKEIKEKYNMIISGFILEQKQKDLTKNKKINSKNFERSKVKVKYEDIYQMLYESEEEDDDSIEDIKRGVSPKNRKRNSLFLHNDLDILNENEQKKEGKKRGKIKFKDSSKKQLIFDNTFLFKNKKKKDVLIKDEIYKILNNKTNEDNDPNKKKSDDSDDESDSDEEEESSSSSKSSESEHIIKKKINNTNNKNKFARRINIKKKKKKIGASPKGLSLLNKLKMDYINEKPVEKVEVIEEEDNSDELKENEHLEMRLKKFFAEIRKLKLTEDEEAKDLIIKELSEEIYEAQRRKNKIRLSNFVELIDNFRNVNKFKKSKFNFLPPIKFSIHNMSYNNK